MEELGEYSVVGSPIRWGGVSMLCFAAAVYHTANYDWSKSWLVMVGVAAGLITLGLILALVGYRRESEKFTCLAGILLNAGGWVTIIIPAIVYVPVRFGWIP